MAGLTYLQICNRVFNRLNETNMTSSNFTSAVGFQQAVKEGVLDAISDINTEELQWPFNHNATIQILATNGTQIYSFPANTTSADFDSFYLKRDDNAVIPIANGGDGVTAHRIVAKPIPRINYLKWVQKFRDRDDAMNLVNYATPDFVFQTQDNPNNFGITPPSNQAYTVAYEYWSNPADMALFSDTPNIPIQFQSVIIDGATYYAYLFRDNASEAKAMLDQFQAGIRQMRTQLINREENMENDVLPHGGGVARSFGYGFGF